MRSARVVSIVMKRTFLGLAPLPLESEENPRIESASQAPPASRTRAAPASAIHAFRGLIRPQHSAQKKSPGGRPPGLVDSIDRRSERDAGSQPHDARAEVLGDRV